MKKHTEDRIVTAGWLRLVIPVLIAAAFYLCAGQVNAENAKVKTRKTSWEWEFWTAPGDEDGNSFARCRNTDTGEILSGGWYAVDDGWYFFNNDGYCCDDFHNGIPLAETVKDDDETIKDVTPTYFWEKDSKGWRYYTVYEVTEEDTDTDDEDSEDVEEAEKVTEKKYLTDCRMWIDGHIYFFDEDGYIPSKGWLKDKNGVWYYILPSGAAATGWKKIGRKWYFFERTNGKMVEEGSYDTRSPFAVYRRNYLFTDTGAMKESVGWVVDEDGNKFYSNADGTAFSGWKIIDGRYYYYEYALGGLMATSKDIDWYQGGYLLDEEGQQTGIKYSWHQSGESWWYGSGKYYVSNATVYINSWEYNFDEDGYCRSGKRLSDGYIERYVVKGYSYTEEELYLMAAVIYCEAGAEPYEGQLAVGNVVMNRLKSSKYPNTIKEVIYQPYQFSVVNSQKFQKCLTTGGSETALRAAKEAFAMNNNNVEGCIGFRLASSVDPDDDRYIIIGHIAFH